MYVYMITIRTFVCPIARKFENLKLFDGSTPTPTTEAHSLEIESFVQLKEIKAWRYLYINGLTFSDKRPSLN